MAPDPQQPRLGDALTDFRAAADAAAERGRRIAGDANGAGTAFQRESEDLARHAPRATTHRAHQAQQAAADLQATARAYRTARGLPLPDAPEDSPKARRRSRPDDEDFSNYRVMRPL